MRKPAAWTKKQPQLTELQKGKGMSGLSKRYEKHWRAPKRGQNTGELPPLLQQKVKRVKIEKGDVKTLARAPKRDNNTNGGRKKR